ncbi:MAG: shikimate kinase [Acidobacteriota bacterium]
MGVAGAGKTTLGKRLARRLDWIFVDAGDPHEHQEPGAVHASGPALSVSATPVAVVSSRRRRWLLVM